MNFLVVGIKIFFFWLSLCVFMSWSSAYRQFPVTRISYPSCKFVHRDIHPETCRIDLPMFGRDDHRLLRRVYTVLWSATYRWWRDRWQWAHPWIDIATARGTPVFAIGTWIVIRAEFHPAWWNIVSIEHDFRWQRIVSHYAHLDRLMVSVSEHVGPGRQIGTVWDTWNSFGNHLHFQIDNNRKDNSLPYFPQWCRASIMETVNTQACGIGLMLYTIDPLIFFDQAQHYDNSQFQQYQIIDDATIKQTDLNDFFTQYRLDAYISTSRLQSWQQFFVTMIPWDIKNLAIRHVFLPQQWRMVAVDRLGREALKRVFSFVDRERQDQYVFHWDERYFRLYIGDRLIKQWQIDDEWFVVDQSIDQFVQQFMSVHLYSRLYMLVVFDFSSVNKLPKRLHSDSLSYCDLGFFVRWSSHWSWPQQLLQCFWSVDLPYFFAWSKMFILFSGTNQIDTIRQQLLIDW